MAKLVSKTYGDALFEVALEKDALAAMADEVKAVADVLANNGELLSLLNHPKIVKEEKIQVIKTVFENAVSGEMLEFLVLVVTKGRQNDISSILEYFIDRYREHSNIGVAYVTTPMEMSEAQKEAVLKKLLDTTKYVEFEMHYSVDPTLIGGMVIRIGDRVVDSSIKTKLDNLSKNLKTVQLA
ncbi:MAG: ATP synthase F1 subunit delta [Lachnospiraceae bacterium]|nr:ATP synthase F1 subunit delta [Lachnospiraceae bacterium]